jgi:recombination protein RecA
MLSGKEKAGKTLTGLHLMARYQRAGRLCFYINVEGRLKRRDLQGINGLDANKVEIITSTEGNILSGEDFVNITSNIIKSHPRCYILMDSASALCSSKELTEEITATGRVLGPKILAAFCRQNATVIPIQRITLVLVQHLIANTSGYGAAYYEDGGNKVKYQGDVHLRCSTFDKWVDKDGNQIGQVPTWQVKYSALGPPGGKIKSWIRYGSGIDEVMEIIEIGTDLGLISKGGAWYTLDFLDEPEKVQGQEKLHEYLVENPDRFELLKSKVMELLT